MDWGIANGFLFLIFIFAFLAIGIGGFIFWIFMIVDVVQRKFDKEDTRLMWILIVVLTGLIGAIIYYFMVKDKDAK